MATFALYISLFCTPLETLVNSAQQCFEWMRHYVTEHHESEAIRWKQAPAKNSAEILHQQLVVKR